jgi:hypothetical protein
LRAGDTVSLQAESRSGEDDARSCFYIDGYVEEVRAIQFGQEEPLAYGHIGFVESRSALHEAGCQGIWTFGLALVSEKFKGENPGLMATRYIAFRHFLTPDTRCTVSMAPLCSDYWFVEITDKTGAAVAR